MNQLIKQPIEKLGYDFIPAQFLPNGKDEYYLRFQQNPASDYRALTKQEITILLANGNRSTDWSNVLVREGIDIHLIEGCTFYGLVRIGKLEPYFVEFSELRVPVGLYRSLIVACDLGDNVSIQNVQFLSHYIIANDVVIANVNEMSVTSHAKFGNGIIKDGEPEDVRIWMELRNENTGRKVMPFDGMLPGDAWLWSKFRGDNKLMEAFKTFTEKKFNARRGYYGTVGARTIIKNCHIIKDVKIGSDAYLKGANKLKNLTVNSSANAKSQIGEGCEMVNGIMGYGSRAFYGVKAVRFMLGDFSQLKYGARLINSYLGENSTISCCEVLNALIFPAHEQHHNNSFLCAALLKGQSNMAAGATIGSNHNSRGADGEIEAGRGFWPGLCVSLKHNSRFAAFTMIAKGDFPYEMNIPLPFSLLNNELHTNRLIVMPAYWMMYNMYAILRNEDKFAARDKRLKKIQLLEYDFLAPDTASEMMQALTLLEKFAGKSFFLKHQAIGSQEDYIAKGKELLEHHSPELEQLEIFADGFENSKRPVQILKAAEAYHIYKKMLEYYGCAQLAGFMLHQGITTMDQLVQKLPCETEIFEWQNVGSQLMPASELNMAIEKIKTGKINSWNALHDFYREQASIYAEKKLSHALACLFHVKQLQQKGISKEMVVHLLRRFVEIKEWLTQKVTESKIKDYKNPFRQMLYDSPAEMETVLGAPDDNSFIKKQEEDLSTVKTKIEALINNLS